MYEELTSDLSNRADRPFIAMYHGAVLPGRGIECAIEAIAQLPCNYLLVVLGEASNDYLSILCKLCDDLNVVERVLFHSAVPREGLEAYVAAADVGLVTVEAVSESYYYMLPNKFFENVQAETPMVVSNFPETMHLVNMYGIGLTCDPFDARRIAECIRRLAEDESLYAHCKRNLLVAKQSLCWEKERTLLQSKFEELLAK